LGIISLAFFDSTASETTLSIFLAESDAVEMVPEAFSSTSSFGSWALETISSVFSSVVTGAFNNGSTSFFSTFFCCTTSSSSSSASS